jgi:hypothetical protein
LLTELRPGGGIHQIDSLMASDRRGTSSRTVWHRSAFFGLPDDLSDKGGVYSGLMRWIDGYLL